MSKCTEQQKTVPADEQIVELYWQRDERAIVHTDTKYGQYLFRIAYNILHDRLDCEECQNDTYNGIWNAIPPTRPTVFPAFITQIMRNIATERYKHKTSKKRIPSALTVSIEELINTLHSDKSVDNELQAEEVGKIISNYVRTLSKRQRFVFMGRYYTADTAESIAEELEISVPTVYRELDRIKKGLKIHLERNGVYL